MTEEPIIVEIDDSQLDAVIMKLDLLGTKTDKIIGGTGRGGKKLDTVLPGINREVRLLLGQVPGMRGAMRYYFTLKRLEMGKARMEADVLGVGLLGGAMSAYLAIWATAAILIREILRHRQKLEQQKKDLEMLIRKSRGWTHDEYERGRAAWEEYAKRMPG